MSHLQLLLCLLGIFAAFFNHIEARLEGEGIIGGKDARDGQFPYQISLQIQGQSICGGSILSERFIITAAHCVIDEYGSFTGHPLRVVAGISDLKSWSSSRVAVDVIQVFVPKEYNARATQLNQRTGGDIAILKLNNDIGLSRNPKLGNVQLPRRGVTYEGKTVAISGFGLNYVDVVKNPSNGKYEEVNGKSYGKMRFAKANVLSYAQCQRIFYRVMPIMTSHICAAVVQRGSSTPEGICSGDSGGPLVYEGTQIGVVSTSPLGCKEDRVPAVYTRVSAYLDFIYKVVAGRIDSSIRSTNLRVLAARWG